MSDNDALLAVRPMSFSDREKVRLAIENPESVTPRYTGPATNPWVEEMTNWQARAAIEAFRATRHYASLTAPVASMREKVIEEAAKVVERAKVRPAIAALSPSLAEAVNDAFDEIAAAIRALSAPEVDGEGK